MPAADRLTDRRSANAPLSPRWGGGTKNFGQLNKMIVITGISQRKNHATADRAAAVAATGACWPAEPPLTADTQKPATAPHHPVRIGTYVLASPRRAIGPPQSMNAASPCVYRRPWSRTSFAK
jgi:hypothetical protein